MKSKIIIGYVTFSGIFFSLIFGFLQSIQLGFEKKTIILKVKGANIGELEASYNNRFSRNIILDTFHLDNHSNKLICYRIPDFAYIRRLQMTLKNDSDFRLEKVVFSGANNTITIKNKDIGRFLHVPNHTFNPKTSTYEKFNDSITYSKFIIYSSDLTELLKPLYIKRIPLHMIFISSIIIAIMSVFLYHILLLKNSAFTIKIMITCILGLLLILLTVQKAFFSNKIEKSLLDDSNTITYFKPHTPHNLVYNGDFYHGLIFWEANADSTSHELIDTPFGKGIKVTRGDGDGGYWSLRYIGRPILYHKNHTYEIKFKYKIIKGEDIPFNIGWWVRVNGRASAHRLKLKTTLIIDNWYDAEAEYTFPETTRDPACFLNSLKDYSEVEITDVRILDLNREETQIDFLDQQNTDLVKD